VIAAARSRWIRRGAGTALVGLLVMAGWVRFGPIRHDLLQEAAVESTVVVDRNGAVLYEALSHDGTRAIALGAEQLPPMLIAATLAAEDRRYWSHPGVDPLAMLRALRVNLAEHRIVEGGSTISQQVAKLLINRKDPARHRGVRAKIDEAILALRLEHRFSKRELLALYLNHAAYGNQLVGAERASRAYFGVPAAMLTPAQAAFLAGLPQRPTKFNPYKRRDLAVSRQRTVLARMRATGALTATETQLALDERLMFAAPSRPFDAPHLVEMVLARAGSPRPARIHTTIDRDLQRTIAGIVESHRAALTRHGATNVAVVVLDNASGEWLAWEGSGRYGDDEHGGRVNGPTVPRQPGSALKPFTYALAFEQGYSPASVLADVPTHFPTADPAVAYAPRNYDGRYRGPLLAREALGGSQNIPAVLLTSHVGVAPLVRSLARAGVTTLDRTAAHYGLGITLGNAEVRLDELVAAYAAFARGGLWIEPTAVRAAEPRRTRALYSPITSYWITEILSDAEAREAVFGRGGHLEFPFPAAVKTGTSQAYHDNWTIGSTRQVTVGVWVGNFDRTPLRNSSGVTGAAPIFHAVMLAAETRGSGSAAVHATPIVPRPAPLQSVEVCALSGMKANAWCPTRRTEWLGAEHAAYACDWHQRVDGDVMVAWPPDLRQWAEARPQAPDLGSQVSGLGPRTSSSRRASGLGPQHGPVFSITNPADGATYLIDPTLRREFQSLPLRVTAADTGAVEWFVNGVAAGTAPSDGVLTWPLIVGRHRITARDASGRTVQATIEVR
jgi:penicillin-binding protein 1C